MSLDSKYDTRPETPSVPAERIEAYEHTCHSIVGKIEMPAFLLDAKQRAALFTEKQLEVLVRPR